MVSPYMKHRLARRPAARPGKLAHLQPRFHMSSRQNSHRIPASEQADETGRWRSFGAAVCLLVLGACTQRPASPPQSEIDALRERLEVLEQQVEILQRQIGNQPSPRPGNGEAIDKEIRSLESRRAALLERYTNLHPDVRDIDQRLRLLRQQLESMKQARTTTK